MFERKIEIRIYLVSFNLFSGYITTKQTLKLIVQVVKLIKLVCLIYLILNNMNLHQIIKAKDRKTKKLIHINVNLYLMMLYNATINQ